MAATDATVSCAGDDADGPDAGADDVVAWSELVREQARRVLASGGPDPDTAAAIHHALARVEADRAAGDSVRESTMHLQQVLDHDELHRG